ncbi:hypothetical protein Tco_1212141 [Tanacetum coccineum]
MDYNQSCYFYYLASFSWTNLRRVGTPAGRVILFGIIPTTIPDATLYVTSPTTHIDTTPIPIVLPTILPSPDYTPASLDYSPASDIEFDPSKDLSSDHIPPLPATSPFLSSTDDSLDSYIPNTSPSPTHDTPFTETTLSTQRSPVASSVLRHRVMILSLGQLIPHGRPYRYHPNGPVHMMTAGKRVGPLPTHQTSSDSSADALSDSTSSHSSSDHLLPTSHDSSSASPSRKRIRSPVASIPLYSFILGALYVARVDLLPSPKRIRNPESATDLGVVQRIILSPSGVDVRVEAVTIARDDVETSTRDPIVVSDDGDTPSVAIETIQRDQGHRIVATGQQSADMVERIRELERDNRRLKDIVDVESQRVTRFRTMPNTRSGASRTRKGANEQSDRRMAEALRARDAVRNLGPLMGNKDEQEEVNRNEGNGNGNRGNGNRGNGNGGNGKGGNGNGNGNGGDYGYNFRGFMTA